MALLEVSNLGIAFGGLQAVSQLDLKIEKGHLYGLIGPNGAGKTTVFNMLTGVYKPTEGNIVLDGNDITGATPEAISKAVTSFPPPAPKGITNSMSSVGTHPVSSPEDAAGVPAGSDVLPPPEEVLPFPHAARESDIAAAKIRASNFFISFSPFFILYNRAPPDHT